MSLFVVSFNCVKDKSMLSRRYLHPLTLGIAIGMIQGFLSAFSNHIHPSGYLVHGLYNTASRALVTAINPRALMVCVLCYAVWFAYSVKRRVPGWARRISDLVIIVCVLLIFHFDPYRLCTIAFMRLRSFFVGVNVSVLTDVMADGMPQIAASAMILIVGIYLLARTRKNHCNASSARESFSWIGRSLITPLARIAGYLQYGYQRYWQFDVVVFAVFIALNALPILFSVINSFTLRDRPNIILIQVDTLRADHLGCYGYSRRTSPNIDGFAAQGMRFQKAISAAPWTSASVAAYMTSQNLRVKLDDPSCLDGPPLDSVQLAEALKDRGYSTVGITSNILASEKSGLARGYDSFDDHLVESSSPLVLSSALKRLNEVKDRKFFMFLLFMDPHSPYILHGNHNFYLNYKGKLGKRIDAASYEKGMNPDDLKYAISLYDSSIAFTDENIGRLFDSLKKMNLYNDTLIVLLSDHGEEFGEHRLIGHGKHLYDESISVPLIIKLPGQKKGLTVGGVFPLLDLFPSIADFLHLNTSPFGLQGTARRLSNLKSVRATDIYSSTDFAGTKSECLRHQGYKLIVRSSGQELYNLKRDAAEEFNVLRSEPSLVSMLGKTLRSKDKAIDDRLVGSATRRNDILSDKETRGLRALGYLQ